jgi:proton-translocating NADH-quinone oxidoreductase chain L
MPPEHIPTGEVLSNLLMVAWLAPLLGFIIEIFAGYWQGDRRSKAAAYLAVGCIGLGFVCSLSALLKYQGYAADAEVYASQKAEEAESAKHHAKEPAGEHGEHKEHADAGHGDEHPFRPKAFSGSFYTLASFGDLQISIDYYIDSLTLIMFTMVTLIATCIHIFAIGYMSDELTDDYVDHQAHTSDGKHLHRPGRFYRFFSFMSLFCFSMLGIVLAGNIFQVFVFWELVGISSYLLIGFYTERKTASTAANKAFIMNRVGDFGFLIGLMIIWTSFGTFNFGDCHDSSDKSRPGIFEMLRGDDGEMKVAENEAREKIVNLNVVHAGEEPPVSEELEGTEKVVWETIEADRIAALATVLSHAPSPNSEEGLEPKIDPVKVFGPEEANREAERVADLALDKQPEKSKSIPYWLLIVAGLGVFGGCIGKSAQFPLQTWLPDAMEGPTPVSALVHSATMVAAGVYLAGRFYPMFTPEVLLVIAYIGCITLFIAATIAMVATDIKRVLAYSTISQLGYMMLALGVGGWVAGLFHLITHAFFKSLMFLASGSVIVGCHHEQEMTKMGGLWRKMPITAFTMLVGVIAISGLAIPGSATVLGEVFAFSGYHSKDAIVATALAFTSANPTHFLLFIVPLVTAGITAFYMFRLWFYTFAGKPRDQKIYDHAHESPSVMTGPLVVLALFAAGCAIGGEKTGFLFNSLLQSEPVGVEHGVAAAAEGGVALPSRHAIHEVHAKGGVYALLVASLGTFIAYLLYGLKVIDPAEIKRQFSSLHRFLVEKWQFDRLYEVMFVRPAHMVAGWCTWADRRLIDGFLHGTCRVTVDVSRWDRKFDEGVIDGLVNFVGSVVFGFGRAMKNLQTGRLRQYVMFIAVGVLTLFVLLFTFLPKG